MPAITDPYGARPYQAPSGTSRRRTSPSGAHSLRLRIRTSLQRAQLTRALAEGTDPGARPELAARAAQLTSDHSRRTIARSLRRTISEAHKPAMTRSRMVIIRRDAVLDAEGAINAMIERLRSSQPVQPQGMALAERILTDADRSPLYNPTEPGTLDRAIGVANAALDADATQSHEVPVRA